ncbi:unnamed protein product [Notodromas monacha]|uniref:Probable ATP-dependent RNA helicase DDX46 n=1 Tax=Notodromas monacha TaxID=399045 RepID=A0A7R9GCS2_9CRUS|nr:unnamed protein product [Notodromas monacha]CAG0916395.1 unnamed protein product [Notodromas monacha]
MNRGRRSRSRSPRSRRRSRSRSRDRRRDNKRSRRSRSRSNEKREKRKRSKSPTPNEKDEVKLEAVDVKPSLGSLSAANIKPPQVLSEEEVKALAKEVEQKRLDAEMQKRKERIEKWRAERKKIMLQEVRETIASQQRYDIPANLQVAQNPNPDSGKKWSLDDDSSDSDEEPAANSEANADDEVDPLDAYMASVQGGTRSLIKKEKEVDGKKKVVIVSGVVKKKSVKNKGELMEQNQDGLEYSSEDEDNENPADMLSGMNKARRDLVKIDHSAIDYLEFRKDFYHEVPEIAKMTPEEVRDYRLSLENITVKGKNCPKPIKAWSQAVADRKILDALKRFKFETPTPIQSQALPAIMSGRDVMGIAKTGSGKTLAFLLPMFRHIVAQPPLEEGDGAISIIMAPTRELCMQIGKDCRKFAKSLGIRAVCVYGGTGISEQIAELKRGAEVIVCTPGRMIDMLAANNGRVTNLRRVTFIVLDEADRMFDMGFEPQVMRIIDNVRPDRQTVLFSATFPRQMEALARRILTKPIEIQVGGRSVVCKDVKQEVVVLEEEEKFYKLLELLGMYYEQGSVLVFVDKQDSADKLLTDLMKHSYSCMALHGGIDQFDRDSTIVDFKAKKFNLLVATSVAARGLDVPGLILVVNYDCPNHYEDYVHRCGRTGRAGNAGFAYTFVTPDQEKLAGELHRALELSEVPIPEALSKMWDRYKARMAAEGKTVKTGGGFHGKGFKFDDSETQQVIDKKKAQKVALGLADSDDEDIEQDIDQQIITMLAPKRTVKEVPASSLVPGKHSIGGLMSVVPNLAAPPGANAGPGILGAAPAAMTRDKLELARRRADMIAQQKTQPVPSRPAAGVVPPSVMANAVLEGRQLPQLPAHLQLSGKNLAEQAAAVLNRKLNYMPPADGEFEPGEAFGQQETFQKFEEELEINDFPQQVRWKITSKEALAQISEYSEAGITVRGLYSAPGKAAPDSERKLYLAIESTNELAVSKAKKEIMRLIREELLRLQTAGHQGLMPKSRYKVLRTKKQPVAVTHNFKPPKKKKKPAKSPKATKSPRTEKSPKLPSIDDSGKDFTDEFDAAMKSNIKCVKLKEKKNMNVFEFPETPGTPKKNPDEVSKKKRFFGNSSPRRVTVSLANNIVLKTSTRGAMKISSQDRVRKLENTIPPFVSSANRAKFVVQKNESSALAAVPPKPATTPRRSPRSSAKTTADLSKTPQSGNFPVETRKRRLEFQACEEAKEHKKLRVEVAEDENVAPQGVKVFPIFRRETWLNARLSEKSANSGLNGIGVEKPKIPKTKATCTHKNLVQTQIDAGQKALEPVTCETCQMVHVAGDEDDQLEHYAFHRQTATALRIQKGVWRQLVVEIKGKDVEILRVDTKSPILAWKKLGAIVDLIDNELGIVSAPLKKKPGLEVCDFKPTSLEDNETEMDPSFQGYLYVNKCNVEGVMIVEPVASANKIIIPKTEIEPLCCSEEELPAVCGVSRMWTVPNRRRKGIASSLLDCSRKTFGATVGQRTLTTKEIAFTDPTPDGLNFAMKYCDSKEFLVYRPML